MGFQIRYFRFDDIPNNININSKVFMTDDISETCDLSPFNLRYDVSHLIWNMFNCFANYLKITDTGMLCAHVGTKRDPSHVMGEFAYVRNCGDDIV